MPALQTFEKGHLRAVRKAHREAEQLVTRYYALAPREWARMPYEVRTLEELQPEEIVDEAFAHVVCYHYTRRRNNEIVDQGELYRICLQDHHILNTINSSEDGPDLNSFLLYVMTHELVHIVRFGQKLQRIDLPGNLRPIEEQNVDRIAHRILQPVRGLDLNRVLKVC